MDEKTRHQIAAAAIQIAKDVLRYSTGKLHQEYYEGLCDLLCTLELDETAEGMYHRMYNAI